MSVQIKICGTTSLDDALASAAAGADLLGYIFYPPSPRAVTVDVVAGIVRDVRDRLGEDAPRMVGVFVDEPTDSIVQILEQASLDLAQLHGSEPPLELRRLLPRAYKVIRPHSRGDGEALVATYARDLVERPELPDFLVDSHHPTLLGGSGMVGNWAVPELLARRYRILLAGGLTPDNVGDAIRQVRPWGVDVVSGVEQTKGRKDVDKLKAFISAVRDADQARREPQD